MITTLLFIAILALLIFVHELGHFIAAKLFGIRVDEFALGFPPRIIAWKKGETTYALNAVPFGGYVKIFGENPDEESISGPDKARSFVHKPKYVQAMVLVAGVLCNLLLAWLLISTGFLTGLPASASAYPDATVRDTQLLITHVVAESPAAEAGLKPGDSIVRIESSNGVIAGDSVEGVRTFIGSHAAGEPVVFTVKRGGEEVAITATPEDNVLSGRSAVGISMDMIGTVRLPFLAALREGTVSTIRMTRMTAVGLWDFVSDAVTGRAEFSQVAGPVGIAGLVGDARALGFAYILSFTAVISINLAIINMVPFPALDGGRILFVAIEAIKGTPIQPRIANAFNAVGFILLILLMIVITFNDIVKLF